MAVRLRLMRMGKKKQPTYRVVAADSRKARNGRFIEIVGTYNPRQEPSLIEIDNERALHWLRHGAQPSERVQKLLVISGAWEEFTGEAGPPKIAPTTVTKAASAEDSEAAPAEVAEAEAAPAEVAEAEAAPAETASEVEPVEPDEDSETESVDADDTASEAESAEDSEQDAEKAEDGES